MNSVGVTYSTRAASHIPQFRTLTGQASRQSKNVMLNYYKTKINSIFILFFFFRFSLE